MRLYDNATESWYEELKSYFPAWYANVIEMDALWHTWGILLDQLQLDIKQVLDNFFINRCDEATIKFWEDFINVHMNSAITLEQRRRILMTLFAGFGKCSKTKIKQLLQKFTGAEAEVEFSVMDAQLNQALKIWIDIQNSVSWDPEDIETILERVVPAHIKRETHFWIQIGGTAELFVGTAYYAIESQTLTSASFDSDALGVDILADENGDILIDETGVVLLD